MSLSKLLSAWRADPTIAPNIVDWRNIPARSPQTAPIPVQLHPLLVEQLDNQNIRALYSHQEQTWNHVQSGHNVAIVTGTASGKTLSYNLPILDRLFRDPKPRALYLFPTKALAQDQLSALAELLPNQFDTSKQFPKIHPSIYDGDTSKKNRQIMRSRSRLVLSNPDMLHIGILPHHTSWVHFFSNLQFVVIDEMHQYRGVFGSHIANVLRRLKRIARFYNARPQFILTSATIANPAELGRRLVEEDVIVIDDDGAPQGKKNFIIYNPPVVNQDLGLRRSALQESVRLADDLLTYNVQTIIFGRSRRTVEIILTYLRQKAGFSSGSITQHAARDLDPNKVVRGYRSGYLAKQRREIELGLRQGTIRCVVTTNALELGIDIGGMGAALLVGYPGSIAATRQQAGRAGRGDEASMAIFVTTAAPLDQFLASHPDYLFDKSPEHALINPDNLLILLDHLRCAAFELPFTDDDSFGTLSSSELLEFLAIFQGQGVIHHSGKKYFWIADQYPAHQVSLRSASADNIILQLSEDEGPLTLGQIDYASALWMVHPRAIYIHEGLSYSVEDLDLIQNIAWLRRLQTDYYTEPRRETTVELIETIDFNEAFGCTKYYGEIQVTSQVIGFRKIKWHTHENLGVEDVTLPPTELLTTGYWQILSEKTVNQLRENGLWSSDPNRYGPNWQMLREQARARDGYCCQVCGIMEGNRAHDVHHKIPFRSFLDPQQANRLDNLVTLCPICHRLAETRVRVRSGLAGMAFALGQLASLFLMCDVRDLGIHSDPQSPLAGGGPTIVIYDQIPAGIGLSQQLFEVHEELISRAYELVSTCQCNDGCPSCVGPGGEFGVGGKRETLALIQALKSE